MVERNNQANFIRVPISNLCISNAEWFSYLYDEKGRKIEYTDITGSETFYKYDDKGHLIYSQTSNQIKKYETFYKYDNEGRLINKTFHNIVPNFDQIISYVYKENKIKQESEYRDGKLRYLTTTVFDDKGRIVEEEILEFNKPKILTTKVRKPPGKTVYKYKDEKREREILKYNPDGFLQIKETTFYDEKGNEIRIESEYFNEVFNPKTQTKTVEKFARINKVEYDSNSNWIKKQEFMPSQTGDGLIPTSFKLERVITYY